MDLLELLRKGGMDGDVDFLREALRVLVEGIMDAEVSARTGAEYGERSPERVTQRNGYRSRAWDTRVGTMELHIPKLREGSYFPSLLEPRRRSERALLAVIQQAYVEGVSTRRVDDLVKALGCEGISKSQVSRICQELDVVVDGFLGRPLDGGPYPYLWLDGLTQKVREDGRIVNVSVVVATAVNGEGKREIIGMDVGTSEDGAFWLAFLRSLSARGLSGVDLVVSDAHQGLRDAIATVFGGASWQRCRTHFMTNLLTRVPRRAQPWVANMVRTIYQQPSPQEVHAQLERVIAQLQDPFPQVASLLDEAGHCQNADLFTGARVLVHPKEIDYSRSPNRGDHQVATYFSDMLAKLKVEPISEGDQIAEGVSVIDTPGHTKGHISVVVSVDGKDVLVTGDALPDGGTVRRGLPYNVFWDVDAAADSVRKMMATAEVFYPGHDRPFTLDGDEIGYLEGPIGMEVTGYVEGGAPSSMTYTVHPTREPNIDLMQKG